MKTIAHISDLHFGTEIPELTEKLAAELRARSPSLVVVSGDLTQRARRSQFKDARDYLARLPKPQLVVPGNHDVPLFDVVRRFLRPTARFKRLINENLDPIYFDDELFVVGINTARSFTWKDGKISEEQIKALQVHLCKAGSRYKVVVTHHPFIPPPDDVGIDLVNRGRKAVIVLDICGADLLLSGHLHRGYAGNIQSQYPASRRSIVAAQAGTAISGRLHGKEPNAYNWITLDGDRMTIEVRTWNGTKFLTLNTSVFRRSKSGWKSD